MQDTDVDNLLTPEPGSDHPKLHEKRLEPVLDQWEVERVLLSLESEDEGIRALVSY